MDERDEPNEWATEIVGIKSKKNKYPSLISLHSLARLSQLMENNYVQEYIHLNKILKNVTDCSDETHFLQSVSVNDIQVDCPDETHFLQADSVNDCPDEANFLQSDSVNDIQVDCPDETHFLQADSVNDCPDEANFLQSDSVNDIQVDCRDEENFLKADSVDISMNSVNDCPDEANFLQSDSVNDIQVDCPDETHFLQADSVNDCPDEANFLQSDSVNDIQVDCRDEENFLKADSVDISMNSVNTVNTKIRGRKARKATTLRNVAKYGNVFYKCLYCDRRSKDGLRYTTKRHMKKCKLKPETADVEKDINNSVVSEKEFAQLDLVKIGGNRKI